ncbi:fatty acyl-AMP ligase [Streptomyces sp. ISL-43]|uniref:fatty acyl-AMP ligase n=1 Tax=Streptomyces sp. ISL-43 TaxID=2819183 RepID=UPI001BE6A28B|nr:fatty acyl-AMP ligase [Streptomyces sp. ISL-43]MBT2446421.1 fatty acyl-AMP ligase [Streptomyces sp. ISL-43]
MTSYSTFTEVVRERAGERGGADAHVFLHDDGTAEHVSYTALDTAARALAVRLRALGAQGEPVLLLYPPGAEFLRSFTGCLYAGAVAVPAPLPGDRGERLQRVSGILRDTGARLVLTDAANAAEVSLWLAMAGRGEVVCLATDVSAAGTGPGPDAYEDPGTGPDDLAFLQYTSGSTSRPRGVMVSHRNLLANQEAFRQAFGTTPDDRFASWLPHYHDLGLIGQLLHPLWLGATSVQMSAASFVRRPARWLRAIDTYGVTVSSAPDFAYDLCVRRVTDEQLAGLDLSRWRVALNGAEPVRHRTLDAFADRFAAAGFRRGSLCPAYGLAEATLFVSGAVPGTAGVRRTVDAAALERDELRPARAGEPVRTLVSSGRVRGHELRVTGPDGRELPPGRVGEIELRGDSVAGGYWRDREESEQAFGAVPGGFLRTGDLGVLDDGELYITGRLKEVAVLSGRNLYPQDVEWAVREMSPAFAAGNGAVFTVDAEREQLVVLQEVRAQDTDWEQLRVLARRIQTLIGQDFEVPAGNVLLVRPGTVRRTTSGKIQRTLMRKLFLAGELAGVYEVLDPAVRGLIRPWNTLLGNDLLQPAGGTAQGTVW